MSPEEEALRLERAQRCIDAPPAVPAEWEIATLHEAVSLSRCRLALPDRIVFRWRFHVSDASRGAHADEVVYVSVSPGTTRDDLAAVVFHELQHVADVHARRAYDRGEWEARAEAFSREMMICWRHGTAPEDETRAIPRPESLRPRLPSRADEAKSYLTEIRRRAIRLRRNLSGTDARAFRALCNVIDRLADVAMAEE